MSHDGTLTHEAAGAGPEAPAKERKATGLAGLLRSKRTHRLLVLAVLAWFFPRFMLFYFVCGLLDVLRNTKRDKDLFLKYFIGSGTITWFLAPFNLFLDLISLPYWNKGVWQLADLPKPYREELQGLLKTIDEADMIGKLEGKLQGNAREMVFFKWSRKNMETSIDVPAFHADYEFIATIGFSVFNTKKSTSKHFGPFRPTFRVLYNLNPVESDDVYIEVGKVKNKWNENRLFIFDDTLFHRSVNESDERRYCAFIDIVRPSLSAPMMNAITAALGAILSRVNHVFYNAWSFIK